MKPTNQCPKCSANDIIADAKAIDYRDYQARAELSVATFRRPEAMRFKVVLG